MIAIFREFKRLAWSDPNRQSSLELEIPTQDEIGHCDVAPLDAQNNPNPDGVINIGDALVILRKALGIISF